MNARAARTTLAVAATAGFAGCSGSTPPPAFPRPLDETSAIAIIAKAYRDGGQIAGSGRELRLASGRMLRMDVGTVGHQFGVAYVTTDDADRLDSPRDLPPPMGVDDLPVVQGSGPDSETVVLVLLATQYVAREPDRARTAPDDERRLRRDVRDFLVQARAHHLP